MIPLGVAAVHAVESDAGTGGVLPNLSGSNSSEHDGLCDNETVPVFRKTTCVTVESTREGRPVRSPAGRSAGRSWRGSFSGEAEPAIRINQ
ncbi:hypothetical protein ACWDZ4_13455 [Streptomyces sp. NPDC003016]